VIWALGCVLAAQTAWGPDEVRSSNHVYELPSLTLTVESKLVDVGIVVRDEHGHVVSGLQREDFRIFDNGKPQAITAFSVETAPARSPAPVAAAAAVVSQKPVATAGRSVVLYFDDSSIASGDLARTRLAARRFVSEALDPGDRVAIMTSSGSQFLDFTADTAKILDMIARLTSHPRMDENGLMPCPRITPYQAYLIINHDSMAAKAALDEEYSCEHGGQPPAHLTALPGSQMSTRIQALAEATWAQARGISQDTLDAIRAAVDHLANAPGRRMLVLASSGFLTATLDAEQDRIVDRALRANVVIHALDAKGLYADSPRPSSPVGGGDLPLSTFLFEKSSVGGRLLETGAAMAKLAESTGGLFFQNNNDLDAGLRSLIPEITYRLAFAPGNAADGKYHSLKVRLTRAEKNHVLTRAGYFDPAPPKPAAQQPDQRRAIDRAAAASDALSQLPVRIMADPVNDTLRVTLVVDVQQLKFTQRDSRRVQKLSFVAALFDESGRFISGKEGELDLALQDATYVRFAGTGISTAVSLRAPPGSFRLRGVVEDSSGQMTATSQTVQIR
jgi:VWFA-related protein